MGAPPPMLFCMPSGASFSALLRPSTFLRSFGSKLHSPVHGPHRGLDHEGPVQPKHVHSVEHVHHLLFLQLLQ